MLVYVKQPDGTYVKYHVMASGNWGRALGGVSEKDVQRKVNSGTGVIRDTAPTGDASQPGNTFADFTGTAEQEEAEEKAENIAYGEEMAEGEWGAANITKDMFVDAQGNPRSIQDVYATLDPILTGITGENLVNYIKDIFPKYTGVPEEEREFAREGFQEDVYGVSKEAAKAGAQMQQAYGSGMGSQMRGAIAGQKDVAQQFKFAEQGYAKDIYGLEKKADVAYETDVLGAIGRMPEDTFAEPGADASTTLWENINWTAREGGKVPSKSETFLDFLTKLPDAGGM